MALVNPSITAFRGFSVTNIIPGPSVALPAGAVPVYSTANSSEFLQGTPVAIDPGLKRFFRGLGLTYLTAPGFKTEQVAADARIVEERFREVCEWASRKKCGIEKKIAKAQIDPLNGAGIMPGWRQGFTMLPKAALRICWLNDRLGYGCFAERDIPEGKCIGEYSGELSTDIRRVMSNYTYAMCTNEWDRYFILRLSGFFPRILVDARHKGNELRFINHAARDAVLKGTSLSAVNVEPRSIFYEGIFRIVYVAGRDIKAGEELRADYGESYWRHKGVKPDRSKVYRFENGRVRPVPTMVKPC